MFTGIISAPKIVELYKKLNYKKYKLTFLNNRFTNYIYDKLFYLNNMYLKGKLYLLESCFNRFDFLKEKQPVFSSDKEMYKFLDSLN